MACPDLALIFHFQPNNVEMMLLMSGAKIAMPAIFLQSR